MEIIENLGTEFSWIYRKNLQEINNKLKKIDITYNMAILLTTIYRNPGITQNELAILTCLEKTNISKILKALLEDNYVRKEYSQTDKRFFNIYLSEAGLEKLLKIKDIVFLNWISNLKNIDEEEVASFLNTLKKISNNMNK